MPIWKVAPVEEQPEVSLMSWAVFEVTHPDGKVKRHFAGYNIVDDEGRVSSFIVEWDPEKRRGRTESGRIYELVGKRASLGSAPMYVWNQWVDMLNPKEVKDISSEYEGR